MDKYNELVNKKLELEEKIVKIKMQIEEAKTKFILTGIISNPIWFNKAKFALEMSKLELKKVNAEYEKHKREIKIETRENNINRNATFEREFINVCKEILSKEVYLNIFDKANEKIESKNEILKKVITKKWSKDDEEYLAVNYKNSTIEELAIHLDRSENSIRSKIQTIKKKRVSA